MNPNLKFKRSLIVFFTIISFSNAFAQVLPMVGQCTVYSISTSYINAGSGAGQLYPTISVTSQNNCTNYTLSKNGSWLSYSQNGLSVTISVQANTGAARDGYVYIGSYTVTVHQACGNVAVAPTRLSVDRNNFCSNAGGNITLNAIGGSGSATRWFSGSCDGTQVGYTDASSITIAAPTTTTTYYARWETSCNNSICKSITVTVNQLPVLSISGTTSVCPGSTYTYTTNSGMTGYSWTLPSGSSGSSSTNSINVTFGSTSGTISVTATDGNGCTSNPANLGITVNYLNQYSVIGSGTTCPGVGIPVSLQGSTNGITYKLYVNGSWSSGDMITGNGGNNVSWNKYAPGTYTITGVNGSCEVLMSGSAIISNYVQSTNPTGINPTSNPMCLGAGTTLTVSGGSLGTSASWKWYTASCGGTLVNTGNSYAVNPSSTTTYWVRAEGLCNTTTCASITITVLIPPVITQQPQNVTICDGASTSFSVSASGAISYQWQNLIGGTWSNISGATSTTYSISNTTGMNGSGFRCVVTGSCSFTTTSNPAYITFSYLYPYTVHSAANTICPGDANEITLDGSSSNTSIMYTCYLNESALSPPVHGTGSPVSFGNHNVAGTYTVKAVNTDGCVISMNGSATVTVKTPSTPATSINANPPNICPGGNPGGGSTLTLVGGSLETGAGVWHWYSGGTPCGTTNEGTNTTSITVNPTVTTVYSVRAEGGCVITSCAYITVNVKPLPVITAQPVNSNVNLGSDASFSVTATGPDLQYQWQVLVVGDTTWTNLTGLPAQNYQTANLTIKGSTTFEDNFYRCRITSDCSTINSGSAKIVLVFPESGYLTGNDIPDPETRQLNTSDLVGATSGSFTINPMGGSSYTIPLESPPGVNGLVPSLSIGYSSNCGPGVVGFGWQIGGLSAISRGPQTIYSDGIANGVNLDINDRFYIDGQRLVPTTSIDYGDANAVYQTENDIFTRVTPQATDPVNGPAWFKAETKSGLVYEYGNIPTSKQKISGYPQVLNWYVSKVSDLFGNQINFTYIQDHSSVYPSEITYGANSITFSYKNRTDKNYLFLKGAKIEQWLLLNKIVIKYNSTVIKTYEFNQSYQGSNYNSYSILNEVIEYGIGSSRLNSTAISYQIPANVAFSQTTYNTNHQYINYNSLLRTGDFNGDGKADFFCLPTDGTWTGIKVFFGDGNDNFPTSFSSSISIDLTRLQDIRVIDLNADGIDDIVYEYRTTPTSTTSTFYYMLCNGSSFTQPVQMGDPQTFSVNAGLTGKTRRTLDRQEDDNEHTANPRDRPSSSSSLSFSKYKNFVDADYNGDGVNDIFMNDLNGNWKIYSLVNSSEQMTSVMNLLASGTISTLNGDVLSGDFNGDGKADIWSFEDNGVNIYTFTGTTLSLLYHSSWPTNKHFFTLGDFNGDGKVDVFLYGYGKGGTEYDWADWQIQLSTGTGFEGHSMTQKKSNLKNDNVRLGDFNGDGATDIMVTSKDFSWTGSYFYISENNGTDFFTDSLPSYPIPSHNFYLADYNGDGHTDFICTDGVSPFWTGYQVYKTTGNTSIMMGKFSNGLGVLTKFDYIKLSQATSWTYQRGTGASYPVIDFQGALTVVDSVQVDNGVGSKNIQMYYYEGAKIHIQGKGFLGYSKTRTTDVTAGIENENISGYSTTYFYPKLLQTLSRRRFVTETVDETDNTYSEVVIDASKKRIFPYIQSSVQSNYLTGLSSTINFQYDTYGNPTLITKNYSNGLTETTSTTYNNTVSSSRWLLGRPDTSTIQYSLNGSPTITRSGTRVFDQNNNHLTSETWYSGTNQIINSFGYNPNGTLKRETGTANGVSRSKSYTYESDSIRTYSSTDQLSHVITKAYDIYGRIDTLQDYFGNTVTYQYDDMGRESNMSKSDGTQTSTAYAWEDPTAAPVPARYSVQKTGNDGSQSKSWYDDLGRVIQSGVKGFDGTWIYTSTIYNTKGQIESTSDPYYSGSTALLNTFSYDDYGRKTNLSRPSGRNTVWGYENNTFSEITAGKSSSKTFSSDGTISSATDEGGTITYTYYPDGKVKTITTPGGIITSMQYDPAGYQSQLVDPSAGTTTYSYNGFGELVSQVSGRNKTTSLVYNPEGTISQKITPEGTSRYIYNTNKQLISVHSPGNIYRFYRYDNKGRIITSIDTIGSSHYTTSVTYDNKGRIDTLIHPSGIIETNTYNLNGYLSSISANGVVHWTTTGVNARQQVTSGRYGNNLNAIYGYDTYGFPTSTVTDTIQNYSYNFDPVTGNLNWRQNNKHSNLKETFYYDNLDRIDSVYKGTTSPVKTLQMTYDINIGGITTKSDVGTLNYPTSGIKPYAVSNINPSSGIIPNSVDSLTYTSFESVNAIYENNNIAHFTYNSDNERVKMDVQQSGSSILTRWYPTSSYIIETSGGVTKEYTFIGGDAYSAPVVAIKQNDTITYYNLLRDYLGSIMQVVNATTNTQVVEYSYDTWGRMRDPITWENYPPGSEPVLIIAGRGFTGHEHLPWFNLINMNGRVYDPLTGSFLSPDPEVQAPDNTQSFNRYTYCLNNPLKYSDPSGYTWFSNFGDWLGSSGKTIVTITAACAVAVAVACIPGLNAVGIAFVGGMLSGATSGGLGAALNGGDVFSGAVMGGIMGAATGLATLGVTSAIGYGLDNIYIGYDRVGINDFFNIGIRQTMSNQSLASILSVGSVINGVSNTALSSGITGGVLSTSLFPRPTIATIPETSRDWIVYSANMTNTYRSSGSLLWYHNGNIMARYSAVSGSGRTLNRNTPAYTIPEGEYSASNYRILNSPYYQNGVGFGVDLTPGNVYDPLQDCYRDGGFLIHPASGGTLGCVGLTGNQCELLDFQSRINTYILINHTIKLYVNYH